jgi:predicted transcriptional regulator
MIQFELRPEIEAQLAAEAQARGLALDRYIEQIVTENAEEETLLNNALQQGLREIAEGNTRPAREVFAEFRREHGMARLSWPRKPSAI